MFRVVLNSFLFISTVLAETPKDVPRSPGWLTLPFSNSRPLSDRHCE